MKRSWRNNKNREDDIKNSGRNNKNRENDVKNNGRNNNNRENDVKNNWSNNNNRENDINNSGRNNITRVDKQCFLLYWLKYVLLYTFKLGISYLKTKQTSITHKHLEAMKNNNRVGLISKL